MERFQKGDASAFEALLSRYERRVYGYFMRQVQREDLARDLLQETFLRVVRAAQTYRPSQAFGAWLLTIAHHLFVDQIRRERARIRPLSLDQPVGDSPDSPTLGERVAGNSADAFDRTSDGELTARLQTAIDALPAEQREVFTLREFNGLQLNEIAELVGIPLNTVKSRLRYALEALRLSLADYAEDLPGAPDPVAARLRA